MIYVKMPNGNEGFGCIDHGFWHVSIYDKLEKIWRCKFWII